MKKIYTLNYLLGSSPRKSYFFVSLTLYCNKFVKTETIQSTSFIYPFSQYMHTSFCFDTWEQAKQTDTMVQVWTRTTHREDTLSWWKLISDQSLGYTEQIAVGNTQAQDSFCGRIKSKVKAKFTVHPPPRLLIQGYNTWFKCYWQREKKKSWLGFFFFLDQEIHFL